MYCLNCEVVTGPRVLALRDIFPERKSRPGALTSFLDWPTELDLTLAVPESTEEKCFRVKFAGAGCSRIVYVDEIAGGLAFKFNDIGKYKDDNTDEQKADVPEWLTPKVMCNAKCLLLGTHCSVLVVASCYATLSELAGRCVDPKENQKDLQNYRKMAICSSQTKKKEATVP